MEVLRAQVKGLEGLSGYLRSLRGCMEAYETVRGKSMAQNRNAAGKRP